MLELKTYESKLELSWVQQGTFTTHPAPRGLETQTAPMVELDGGHYLFLELEENLKRQSVIDWIILENGMISITTPFGMKIEWLLQSVARIYKTLQTPQKYLDISQEGYGYNGGMGFAKGKGGN